MAKTGYAPINGLELYYEIHGTVQPLVMILGALGIIDAMGPNTVEPLLSTLAETRQVIAVELQACGHTADIDRPFSFEQFADDIGTLIRHLGLGKADVLGYSMDGGVALQTAICHSNAVRWLVVVSAPYKRAGLFPEIQTGVEAIDADELRSSPLYETYQRIAPKLNDWPKLIEKTRVRWLLGKDFDWTQAVGGSSGHNIHTDCAWRCGQPLPRSCCRDVCVARQRQAGWKMGWGEYVQVQTRHLACHNVLPHPFVSYARFSS